MWLCQVQKSSIGESWSVQVVQAGCQGKTQVVTSLDEQWQPFIGDPLMHDWVLKPIRACCGFLFSDHSNSHCSDDSCITKTQYPRYLGCNPTKSSAAAKTQLSQFISSEPLVYLLFCIPKTKSAHLWQQKSTGRRISKWLLCAYQAHFLFMCSYGLNLYGLLFVLLFCMPSACLMCAFTKIVFWNSPLHKEKWKTLKIFELAVLQPLKPER